MESKKVIKNASWIIGVQIIRSIVSIVISMLTARFLGPSSYGLINYAASIVAFVAPIMYLGLSGILVQEIVNSPEREGEIIGTAITMSFLFQFDLYCRGGGIRLFCERRRKGNINRLCSL